MSDEIDIRVQPGTGYVVVMPIGVLSMQTVAATRAALLELLANSDRVVVDLSRLQLRHPGCVAVFGSAMQQAGSWPDIKLALIGADPRMLTHLARCAGPAVPVADSRDAALVMTDQFPRLARSPLTDPAEPTPSPVTAIAKANPDAAQFMGRGGQGADWVAVALRGAFR
jgi:anti-anti-sigma regulatory factor